METGNSFLFVKTHCCSIVHKTVKDFLFEESIIGEHSTYANHQRFFSLSFSLLVCVVFPFYRLMLMLLMELTPESSVSIARCLLRQVLFCRSGSEYFLPRASSTKDA